MHHRTQKPHRHLNMFRYSQQIRCCSLKSYSVRHYKSALYIRISESQRNCILAKYLLQTGDPKKRVCGLPAVLPEWSRSNYHTVLALRNDRNQKTWIVFTLRFDNELLRFLQFCFPAHFFENDTFGAKPGRKQTEKKKKKLKVSS